ncbi:MULTISPECIES: D-alanyl-D-alanine carboxypeptidase family protein [Thermaerobacter]|uniref:serine-type D-Ala-D-Ala carboxypeptidase n=1 Tax=Thermaerobacter composti TaxID=554949 RepID=A0ABZ0QTF9_9FIRM|nr:MULTISPECIES: D-alanyl-D-alanine carboxypeptidase family protein [Thermaerobacter]PZN07215.1 MAG: D-alanyl-D-alanine carboxypeptidase [Bacillota bacterium]QBS37951.1 D-alanyl-D-alanine carboxypeptidase [Thermaerobacter sp. FW80]WPD20117.1 D-alanyl-D-alanine carboxypeptidase family protein [Thermaerobacter composti]
MPVLRPRPAPPRGPYGDGRGDRGWRAAARMAATLLLAMALVGAPVPPVAAATAPDPGEGPHPDTERPGGSPGFPTRSAALLVMDAASGQVLWAKNADQPRHPASISKLMTLLLTLEAIQAGQIRLQDQVTVSPRAEGTPGSTAFLEAGERITVEDLIKAVAVASANDACVALAEYISGDVGRFVQRMNQRARELGLTQSRFVDPHGLTDRPGNRMSARDIAVLSRYLVNHHPEILRYTSIWEDWLRKGTDREFWLTNTNKLVAWYDGVDGLKTGLTEESGPSVVVTARKGDDRFIVVVLGAPESDTRWREASRLLDWAFASFDSVPIAQPGQALRTVRVAEGRRLGVPVTVREVFGVTVPRGEAGRVRWTVEVAEPVPAPVAEGQPVGRVVARAGDRTLATAPVVAAQAVGRAGPPALWARLFGWTWPMR